MSVSRRRARCLAPALIACAAMAAQGCGIVPGSDRGREVEVYVLRTDIAPRFAGIYRVEPPDCLTAIVSAPLAAPGLGGAFMLYMREEHKLERFAYARWATSVTSMLEPLLQQALRDSGRFSAVLSAPAPVPSDMRIQSDNLRLLQIFDEAGDSLVELKMNARAYDPNEGRLLGEATFRFTEPATPASPEGGVAAADRAVGKLLQAFADFAAMAAQNASGSCSAPLLPTSP